MKRAFALAVIVLTTGGLADAAGPVWVRANFHAHAASALAGDDGSEPPAVLHRELAERGFQFSVHSVHSTMNSGREGARRFAAERAAESRLRIPGLTVAVAEELTVAPGPHHQTRTHTLGYAGPGNLDHLTVLGARDFIATGTPLARACDLAHEAGGVCIVNHPGPGPMMWEEGLWEAPANRSRIDALEVYNGQGLAAFGVDFEGRYLQATAYDGLGMKIAAVSGADTHGPGAVARVRSRVRLVKAAGRLGAWLLPHNPTGRPELDAATLVLAASARAADVIAAVRARRTVAVYALSNLRVSCPGLGEVRRSGEVSLELTLSRPLAEVTLYREGQAVRTWKNASQVVFHEEITRPAAYVFRARDGERGRLLTSALWYEPPASP